MSNLLIKKELNKSSLGQETLGGELGRRERVQGGIGNMLKTAYWFVVVPFKTRELEAQLLQSLSILELQNPKGMCTQQWKNLTKATGSLCFCESIIYT